MGTIVLFLRIKFTSDDIPVSRSGRGMTGDGNIKCNRWSKRVVATSIYMHTKRKGLSVNTRNIRISSMFPSSFPITHISTSRRGDIRVFSRVFGESSRLR